MSRTTWKYTIPAADLEVYWMYDDVPEDGKINFKLAGRHLYLTPRQWEAMKEALDEIVEVNT